MDTAGLQQIVDQADDALLLRTIDGLAAARDWDLLEILGERCLQAVEMGHQLWGVAMHVDYRLALEAPPAHAARAAGRGSSRFTLGPLSEVAAGGHDWAQLAPHLHDPAVRATIAHERVLRGDEIPADAVDPERASLPLRRMPWEPQYALPVYRDRSAKFPQPDAAVRHVPLDRDPPPAAEAFEDETTDALRDVVRAWWTASAGSADAVGVEGDAATAVATLLAGRSDRIGLAPLDAGEALAVLQWCGASGGAYGTRPGGAAGRFSAWWAAAAVAGLDWPARVPGDDWCEALGRGMAGLRWFRWAGSDPETGWTLRLAVEDPDEGLAWAVHAHDQRDDDDPDTDEA
jgi:hypothetical protein